VHVDARHAILEFSKFTSLEHEVKPQTCNKSFAVSSDSEKYFTVDGKVPDDKMFDELSDIFKTKEGYVRLHTSFPQYAPLFQSQSTAHLPRQHSHKQGLLDVLQCESTKAAVAATLAEWSAEEFEAVAFQRHLCAAALRSFEVMDKTPHGIYQMNINPVSITKIADAPKRVLSGADLMGDIVYALEGIRVLDLTCVLAGPVCGRTLAGK